MHGQSAGPLLEIQSARTCVLALGKCPKLGQSRTNYRRGKDKVVCCYNRNECRRHYSRDCLLPKRARKEQRSRGVEEEFKRIFWKVMKDNNWKPEDFTAKETKEEWSVSSSIDGVHNENVKPGENHLLFSVHSLHHRVNNLSIEKRKTSFA